MHRWNQGRAKIDELIVQGHVERVPADRDQAATLITKAKRHLNSARLLGDSDIDLAYDALHAANRKALSAVLLAQGLRPTRIGGHIAVYEAVRAQLDPPLGTVLAPYTRIRRTRNASDYLGEMTVTREDVHADAALCEQIVDVAARVIEEMRGY